MTNPRYSCRSCTGSDLIEILSLGRMPLANSLLIAEQISQPEPTFPLDLAFCRTCALVQITETVPPERLFNDYVYFSSYSDTMVRHAESLVERLVEERNLTSASLVVEVASNDGYLLQFYKRAGVPVLGIEPARNVAEVAESERGIETVCEFFDLDLARQLRSRGVRPAVVHAHNVLAHVADLNGFVAGLREILGNDGIAIIEVPYVREMVDKCEFDTIYHEHLCYYSLTALNGLFQRHGLVIQDVEQIAIHGGSLRLFVCSDGGGSNATQPGPSVRAMLDGEARWGVNSLGYYETFARRVENLKSKLLELLQTLKQGGHRLAAYGAAAKGATLLNYCGIGTDILDFVVDRSTQKQGRFMPGVHLPIYAPERLVEAMPDYTLLLTWNFAEEILKQQAEYQAKGGKFVIPIPEPRVLE